MIVSILAGPRRSVSQALLCSAPLTKAIFSLSRAEPLGTCPEVIFAVWERQVSLFYGGGGG